MPAEGYMTPGQRHRTPRLSTEDSSKPAEGTRCRTVSPIAPNRPPSCIKGPPGQAKRTPAYDSLIYLVHHADAEPRGVDPQRPLTPAGQAAARGLASRVAARGARPVEIWHSGKLRARQTGEAFRLACQPLAQFTMVRGLQPADPSDIMADELAGETRDLMLVGHMPHIARLLRRLIGRVGEDVAFPPHGVVAVEPYGNGWREAWRLSPEPAGSAGGMIWPPAPG